MNGQTKEVINQFLIDSIKDAEKIKTFVVGQTPEVLNQILLWKLFESLFPILILWIVTIYLGYSCWYMKRHRDPAIKAARGYEGFKPNVWYDGDGDLDVGGLIMWGLFLLSLLIILIVMYNETTWLKVLLAPKMFLLEYAAELVK